MTENVKPIILTDNETGMEYTLEFTKETVKFAEMHGFEVRDLTRFPMTAGANIWFYAFRAHHKNVPRNRTDAMLEEIGGLSDELAQRLGELYAAPFEVTHEAPENPRMTVKL